MEIETLYADTPERLGDSIRIHRMLRRMSQQELADAAGVSRQSVVRIENGSPNARIGTVLALMNVLGFKIPYKLIGHGE